MHLSQAACAAAVIAIVAVKLLQVDVAAAVSTSSQQVKPHYTCLMTDETENPAVCNYAIVAGSFSLIATAAVSILQVGCLRSLLETTLVCSIDPAAH